MKQNEIKGTKLGRRLIVFIILALVVSYACIAVSAYYLYKNVYEESMVEQADAVHSILQKRYEDIRAEVDRVDAALSTESWLAGGIVSRTASSVRNIFEAECNNREIDAVFFNATGSTIWATNAAPSEYDPAIALAGKRAADLYREEDGTLVYRTIRPVYSAVSNTTVVGGYILLYDMSHVAMVDAIKTQANAEATVFSANKRIATTILTESGGRNIGSEMDPAIAQTVLTNGEAYTGEANILGVEMQVRYEPLTNKAGEVLGSLFIGMPLTEANTRFGNRALIVMAIALFFAVVVVLLVVYVLRKYVFKPLKSVADVMQQLSAGNLHAEHAKHNKDDEFGDLINAMNIMVTQLQTYIGDITKKVAAMAQADYTVRTGVDYIGDFRPIDDALKDIRINMGKMFATLNDSAEQVYNGSMQISQTAQLLAEGSATQAGTIEELSASIQEIATNVTDSAENVQQVSKLYNTVGERIDDQDRHMDQVLAAMNEIEVNSSKIQNIIRTIEDIAFQTNILALNAAVEAARAGTSGKGFAVVAEEVRSLAAKSAEAAKETTELISGTITSVEKGSDVARTAADAIKEVVDLSRQTQTLIDDVRKRSDEQAESLRQVTVGLDQISTVVQQNSASAEESSAASVELSSQSYALRDVVNKSKV